MKKPTAIMLSDLHLREDTPVCRTDNFLEAQTKKLKFIRALQEKHDCPILASGDIFHKWKVSPFLLSWAIEHLPNMIVIPGQHDLPQHNMSALDKSGLYVLEKAEIVQILREEDKVEIAPGVVVYGFPFGSVLKGTKDKDKNVKIAMCHTLTWSGKVPYPGCKDPSGYRLLKKLSGFDFLLVGDNHKSFSVEDGNRRMLSPGSLSRQSASQIDSTPTVYLYSAESNTVTPVLLPIERQAVSRSHIEKDEARGGRIEAFIEKIGGEWEAGMSFEKNLEKFFQSNKVLDSVKQIVYTAIDMEK